MKKLKKFKNEDFSFYAAEIRKGAAETKKFEEVTSIPFTIDNARHALLTTADSAMCFFCNDNFNPKTEKLKKKFNKILRSLPYKSLPDISNLIKTEILAHLRLNYGDLAITWLITDFSECSLPHFTE